MRSVVSFAAFLLFVAVAMSSLLLITVLLAD
jgi:hypothetical protein